MFRKIMFLAAVTLLMFATTSFATVITDTTGLTSPHTTITFSEVAFNNGDPVTTQYASYGVTFASDSVFYNSQPGYFSSDPSLANFSFTNSGGRILSSLYFTQTVNGAAFNFITNLGISSFAALLNETTVESFTAATDTNTTMFYGFDNISFNEIQFLAPLNFAAEFDNLQISSAAPVPEPSTFILFGAGLAGFGLLRRRMKK